METYTHYMRKMRKNETVSDYERSGAIITLQPELDERIGESTYRTVCGTTYKVERTSGTVSWAKVISTKR